MPTKAYDRLGKMVEDLGIPNEIPMCTLFNTEGHTWDPGSWQQLSLSLNGKNLAPYVNTLRAIPSVASTGTLITAPAIYPPRIIQAGILSQAVPPPPGQPRGTPQPPVPPSLLQPCQLGATPAVAATGSPTTASTTYQPGSFLQYAVPPSRRQLYQLEATPAVASTGSTGSPIAASTTDQPGTIEGEPSRKKDEGVYYKCKYCDSPFASTCAVRKHIRAKYLFQQQWPESPKAKPLHPNPNDIQHTPSVYCDKFFGDSEISWDEKNIKRSTAVILPTHAAPVSQPLGLFTPKETRQKPPVTSPKGKEFDDVKRECESQKVKPTTSRGSKRNSVSGDSNSNRKQVRREEGPDKSTSSSRSWRENTLLKPGEKPPWESAKLADYDLKSINFTAKLFFSPPEDLIYLRVQEIGGDFARDEDSSLKTKQNEVTSESGLGTWRVPYSKLAQHPGGQGGRLADCRAIWEKNKSRAGGLEAQDMKDGLLATSWQLFFKLIEKSDSKEQFFALSDTLLLHDASTLLPGLDFSDNDITDCKHCIYILRELFRSDQKDDSAVDKIIQQSPYKHSNRYSLVEALNDSFNPTALKDYISSTIELASLDKKTPGQVHFQTLYDDIDVTSKSLKITMKSHYLAQIFPASHVFSEPSHHATRDKSQGYCRAARKAPKLPLSSSKTVNCYPSAMLLPGFREDDDVNLSNKEKLAPPKTVVSELHCRHVWPFPKKGEEHAGAIDLSFDGRKKISIEDHRRDVNRRMQETFREQTNILCENSEIFYIQLLRGYDGHRLDNGFKRARNSARLEHEDYVSSMNDKLEYLKSVPLDKIVLFNTNVEGGYCTEVLEKELPSYFEFLGKCKEIHDIRMNAFWRHQEILAENAKDKEQEIHTLNSETKIKFDAVKNIEAEDIKYSQEDQPYLGLNIAVSAGKKLKNDKVRSSYMDFVKQHCNLYNELVLEKKENPDQNKLVTLYQMCYALEDLLHDLISRFNEIHSKKGEYSAADVKMMHCSFSFCRKMYKELTAYLYTHKDRLRNQLFEQYPDDEDEIYNDVDTLNKQWEKNFSNCQHVVYNCFNLADAHKGSKGYAFFESMNWRPLREERKTRGCDKSEESTDNLDKYVQDQISCEEGKKAPYVKDQIVIDHWNSLWGKLDNPSTARAGPEAKRPRR